jgi:hypothetical protein
MSADRDWNTRHDNDLISGHVVSPADDDTLDEGIADEQVRTPAPETYLHKVAGPRTYQAPPPEHPDEADDAALEDRATAADPATAYPATADPATTDPDLPVATDLSDRDTDLPDTDLPDTDLPDTDLPDTDLPDTDLRDADMRDNDQLDSDVPAAGRHAFPDADSTESAVPESAVPDTTVPDSTVPGSVSPAAEANGRAPMARRPGDETNLTPSVTSEDSLLGDSGALLAQWKQAQAGFVEDPRASVNEAAGVVADAASMLEAAIRERQENLRGEWDGDGKADTETLRQAMLVYRRLLDKLVS